MLLKKVQKYCIIKKKTKGRAKAVNFDIFAPDYGILPAEYFTKSVITNPIELFWSDDLASLLRLSGEGEETIGARASDYDRFLALCRALPLLEGHPTRAWIISVLQKYFHLEELPTQESAPVVWKNLSQTLLKKPLRIDDFVRGAWLCDNLTLEVKLPQGVTPVLHANLSLQTKSRTALSWSAEIATTVLHFAANQCKKIVFQIDKNFEFTTPSLYGVDRALSLAKKDRKAENLLVCQLMRELCTAAQRNDLLLVVVCDGDSSNLARLLQYCEENVGLPRLCFCTRDARDAQELLAFGAKLHKNEVLAALFYESVMTQSELFETLASWQVRYPVGRLCYVTARDIRQMPYAQAHISDMLEKSKTKI